MPTFYTLPLTPTPNGLDYSGLSTSHTRIAWAYLEIANTCSKLFFLFQITMSEGINSDQLNYEIDHNDKLIITAPPPSGNSN